MSKSTKKITRKQFYQLLGLLEAKKVYDNKLQTLHEIWNDIVNEEGKDRFWDFYLDNIDEKDVISKLKFDGVEIIPSKIGQFYKKIKKTKVKRHT